MGASSSSSASFVRARLLRSRLPGLERRVRRALAERWKHAPRPPQWAAQRSKALACDAKKSSPASSHGGSSQGSQPPDRPPPADASAAPFSSSASSSSSSSSSLASASLASGSGSRRRPAPLPPPRRRVSPALFPLRVESQTAPGVGGASLWKGSPCAAPHGMPAPTPGKRREEKPPWLEGRQSSRSIRAVMSIRRRRGSSSREKERALPYSARRWWPSASVPDTWHRELG